MAFVTRLEEPRAHMVRALANSKSQKIDLKGKSEA